MAVLLVSNFLVSNFARLVLVKARYDPQNLFRVNQNIQPAAV